MNRKLNHRWCAIAAVAWLLAGANVARAIEIEQVQWGFDGQVVPQRFNLLSVLIANPTPQPFEARLRLRAGLGRGSPVGAPIEEPIFVSPFSSRWVQFYPYVQRGWDAEWTLSWSRRPGDSVDLLKPRYAPPARVLLDDPGGLSRPASGLKGFAENLFPPLVTATDGLASVVLDHVPRWEEPRRQAFLDWLHRGGTVHILHGDNGKFPEFPSTFGELAAPLDSQRVGAGKIVRHARARVQLDRDFVKSVVFDGAAPLERPLEGAAENPSVDDSVGEQPAPNSPAYRQGGVTGDGATSDMTLFTSLVGMTRPKHNWTLIHVMSVVYIALIFPGCFLFSRKRRDYRWTFSWIVGTVALFSLGFSVVGKRGYGEATAVHAVAVARPVAGGFYDVTQWSNAFVTDGDTYPIAHDGTAALYTSGQETEEIRGVIRNGAGGGFLVDIPPYSSRSFMHRVKVKAGVAEFKVVAWETGTAETGNATGKALKKLVLTVAGDFPEKPGPVVVPNAAAAPPPGFTSMVALYKNEFYNLSHESGRLELRGFAGSVASTLQELDNDQTTYGFNPWQEDTRTPEQRFLGFRVRLVAHDLRVFTKPERDAFQLPDDRVRLFIYAPMPERFFANTPGLGKQAGYVLYCVDVLRPEAER